MEKRAERVLTQQYVQRRINRGSFSPPHICFGILGQNAFALREFSAALRILRAAPRGMPVPGGGNSYLQFLLFADEKVAKAAGWNYFTARGSFVQSK